MCNIRFTASALKNDYILLISISERMFLKKVNVSHFLHKSQSRLLVHCVPEAADLVYLFLYSMISSFARGASIQRTNVDCRCRVDSVQLQWGLALVTGQVAKV